MNCSMALEARELERNKVFGSAMRAKQKRDGLGFRKIIREFNLQSAFDINK